MMPYNERYGLLIGSDGRGGTTFKLRSLDYQVIGTDYDNWAVAYGCDEWWWGFYHTK